jgi:hypothetical protein
MVGDDTVLVVIDTQLGMFETPGVLPVPNDERLLRKCAEQVILHHNEVMGNGFASVVPVGEITFGERAGA